MMAISSSIVAPMPGRCTFTATSVPSFSTARCTWAREAAAKGSSSNEANTSGMEPQYSSMTGLTAAKGSGATRSVSAVSSAISSGGRRSRRRLMSCPNLMKVGPSSSRARRTLLAVVRPSAVPEGRRMPSRAAGGNARWMAMPNPYFTSTLPI